MNDQTILAKLNSGWPPSVLTLHGSGTAYHLERKTLDMTFKAVPQFCHSGGIVQGGYITGMLDAVMAYALIGFPETCEGVATLEIKVNFIAPGTTGPMSASGWVVHHGRSIGYLAGELFQDGKMIATATSTVKLLRGRN